MNSPPDMKGRHSQITSFSAEDLRHGFEHLSINVEEEQLEAYISDLVDEDDMINVRETVYD